jgi:hypothetical protein
LYYQWVSKNLEKNMERIFVTRLIVNFLIIASITGCGGSDTNVVVGPDLGQGQSGSAIVTFVNITDESVDFFVKNESEPKTIFDDDFKVIELASLESGGSTELSWQANANDTFFGIQDTNTQGIRFSRNAELENQVDNWAVGVSTGEVSKPSVISVKIFPKNKTTVPNQYSVRVFTVNASSVVNAATSLEILTTEPERVSTQFTVEGCNDVLVNDLAIDLCQLGTVGNAYLVLVNFRGDVAIVREN